MTRVLTRGRARGRARRCHGGRARAAAGALAAMVLAPAAPSFAYVQSQIINNGAPVLFHWNQIAVPITVYPNDMPTMTVDEVELASSEAAAAWSKDQLACTFLDVQVSASFDATRAAGSDKFHVLIFRSQWCDPAQPGLCQREALAVTSVFAGKTSGKIQDADIEVNTENFVWADLMTHPGNGKQDLQNALTHEMGHLVGLDHNCFAPGFDVNGQPLIRQIDNTGAPVPDCASAPLAVRQATMFNSAELGDQTKRSLEADDIQAICDIYPIAHPPTPDAGDSGCGCRVSSSSRASLASTAGLALALALARSRCRRRPR